MRLLVVLLLLVNIPSIKLYEKSIETSSNIISIEDSIDIPEDTVLYEINRGTRYNPSINQCDESPLYTADGSFIDTIKLKESKIRWCALSWDLVDDMYRRKVRNEDWAWRGRIKFGDTIYIESKSKPMIDGWWIVHDVMSSRYRRSIDLLYHKDNMSPKLGICRDIVIKQIK